jgi:hypothetical protein
MAMQRMLDGKAVGVTGAHPARAAHISADVFSRDAV